MDTISKSLTEKERNSKWECMYKLSNFMVFAVILIIYLCCEIFLDLVFFQDAPHHLQSRLDLETMFVVTLRRS